jgi:dihydrofolate reductase
MINAILACDRLGGIPLNGVMPWPRNKEDLLFFKKMTTNSTVIMGRNTWNAVDMPSPLPNRRNIVITSNPIDGVECMTMENFKTNYIYYDSPLWIIGGAKLFHSCLDIIDTIYLTHFTQTYNCDTFIDLDYIHKTFKLVDCYKVDDSTNKHYRLIFNKN